MGVEIERKFKVRGDFRPSGSGTEIAQGYLSRDPKRTVRVRIAGSRGFLTIKGENRGAVRAEYEYAIPLPDARELPQGGAGRSTYSTARTTVSSSQRWSCPRLMRR